MWFITDSYFVVMRMLPNLALPLLKLSLQKATEIGAITAEMRYQVY